MKKIIALAALAAISATASATGSNLLTDGSFESIVQAPGTWNTYTHVPGWTVTKANGQATSTGLEIRDNIAGTAEDGHNFIELDGYENDMIKQSFATTVGKEYEISFWFADRAGVARGSEGFVATVKSGSDVSTGFGAIGDNGAAWHLVTMDFVAASTTSVFSIKATGKSDGYGTSFDNFQATAAIPEPATVGLFAAGIAVLGLTSRRRRQ